LKIKTRFEAISRHKITAVGQLKKPHFDRRVIQRGMLGSWMQETYFKSFFFFFVFKEKIILYRA
jgi:hypothetical protein